jgi:nitroimidazol reductase NimA-like FMN-containing flavoprotein (pyridoxamine 5'-phosphate oxidase superfamily)
MKEPISKVDVRFSDRDAVATSWEVTRSVLETAELFWITTVRGDGRPHVTPLVAVWSEDALYVSMGIDERKTLNLRRNAHVVLTTGCNDWDRGLDVVVEGEADQVIDRQELVRVAKVWTEKWDHRWQYVVGDDCFHHPGDDSETPESVLVFRVTPTKVFAFAKGNFSHTTHTF